MIEAIDLCLTDPVFQSTSLASHGISDENASCLRDVLALLGLEKVTAFEFPTIPRSSRKNDLTQHLVTLLKKGELNEVIGSRVLGSQSVVHYSTLVTPQPRPYFTSYCKFLEGVRVQAQIPTVVWLEDVACLPRFKWSGEAVKEASVATSRWFREHGQQDTMLLSSENGAGRIPVDFIDRILGRFGMTEFFDIVPFYKRNYELILTSDVSHCVWNIYVLSQFPGLHFAGANNKRNYMTYRKLLGKAYSAALLPTGTTV